MKFWGTGEKDFKPVEAGNTRRPAVPPIGAISACLDFSSVVGANKVLWTEFIPAEFWTDEAVGQGPFLSVYCPWEPRGSRSAWESASCHNPYPFHSSLPTMTLCNSSWHENPTFSSQILLEGEDNPLTILFPQIKFQGKFLSLSGSCFTSAEQTSNFMHTLYSS